MNYNNANCAKGSEYSVTYVYNPCVPTEKAGKFMYLSCNATNAFFHVCDDAKCSVNCVNLDAKLTYKFGECHNGVANYCTGYEPQFPLGGNTQFIAQNDEELVFSVESDSEETEQDE